MNLLFTSFVFPSLTHHEHIFFFFSCYYFWTNSLSERCLFYRCQTVHKVPRTKTNMDINTIWVSILYQSHLFTLVYCMTSPPPLCWYQLHYKPNPTLSVRRTDKWQLLFSLANWRKKLEHCCILSHSGEPESRGEGAADRKIDSWVPADGEVHMRLLGEEEANCDALHRTI